MSMLHRQLLADFWSKVEQPAKELIEAAVAIAAPEAAPIVDTAINVAEKVLAPTPAAPAQPNPVAAVQAASDAPAPQAPAPQPAPAPVTPVATQANVAALAAVQALELQLSQLATQLQAMKAQLG